MGDLSNFFCKSKKYMSLEGEFRCCHLVFGVFCPQIHVFWDLWLKSHEILKMMATYGVWPSFSEIHEHGGNIVC